MKQRNYSIILAGGKGERFWPLSTSRRPKQFLSLMGGSPLLAQAVDRLKGMIPPEHIFVVTNREFIEVAHEAAPDLPRENIIGEPFGRDTAAAIALGVACCLQRDTEAVCAVMTADHIMGDQPVFQRMLSDALDVAAQRDVLITLGVPPHFASTGYGYIEKGERQIEAQGGTCFEQVIRFVEKPDAQTAESYLQGGTHYWNSGMFIGAAASFMRAFTRYAPPLASLIERLSSAFGTGTFEMEMAAVYEGLEKISIDYAVMEKADNVLVAPVEFAWDDVGSWPALERHVPADAQGNVIMGEAEHVDAANTIVYSQDRLTALVGVRDLIVVQGEGVTLVCHKDEAERVKALVGRLAQQPARRNLT